MTKTGCTPLAAWESATRTALNMTVSPKQKTSLSVWAQEMAELGATIEGIVGSLGDGSLVARMTLSSGLQGALLSNQWHTEIEHWWATILAQMQRIVVEYATGPSDQAAQPFTSKPSNDETNYLCKNQVC